MITKITINAVATYQNLARLNDLQPINYIFGSNGTGKTTISRVIEQTDGHQHCQLNWLHNTVLDVLVYNSDFVERNFNQDCSLKGVFTLGDKQVEAEREIALLKPEITKLTHAIASLRNQLHGEDGKSGKHLELNNLEPEIRDKCWKKKQLHDKYFQVAFSGVRNSAEHFKDKVLTENNSNTADLFALYELKEKANTIFSQDIAKVFSLSELSAESLIETESHALLQKPIVGNQDVDIAALIEQLGNSDWVKTGFRYHQRDPTTCPFCQQITDKQLTKDLKAFFSDSYDRDIQALKTIQSDYVRLSEDLLSTIQGNANLDNQLLKTELSDAEAQALSERLKRNQLLLESKIAEPSRKVALEPIRDLVVKLQALIVEANEETVSHNRTVDNIFDEKNALTAQVWRFVLDELTDDLSQYNINKTTLEQAIQGMNATHTTKTQELDDLKNRIHELEKNTTSTVPTKDALNSLLNTFGFNSFAIDVSDDGRHYKICRDNGDDASRTLSEGERTFITFLYFYSLIKGAQLPSGVTNDRVVVFDDPISSLDSDILYIVSSLMKAIIEDVRNNTGYIKQVFVLTHNVYFHKEITFHKNRSKNNALSHESFWIVKKQEEGSIVQHCTENPIRSAYELLWEDINSKSTSSVSLQNTLRRILENYFTMWGGKSKDEICDLFKGREKVICQSLFAWVNDGSHSIHDDLYINHGTQTNETYLRVFHDIFKRSGQIGHYLMMSGEKDTELFNE